MAQRAVIENVQWKFDQLTKFSRSPPLPFSFPLSHCLIGVGHSQPSTNSALPCTHGQRHIHLHSPQRQFLIILKQRCCSEDLGPSGGTPFVLSAGSLRPSECGPVQRRWLIFRVRWCGPAGHGVEEQSRPEHGARGGVGRDHASAAPRQGHPENLQQTFQARRWRFSRTRLPAEGTRDDAVCCGSAGFISRHKQNSDPPKARATNPAARSEGGSSAGSSCGQAQRGLVPRSRRNSTGTHVSEPYGGTCCGSTCCRSRCHGTNAGSYSGPTRSCH